MIIYKITNTINNKAYIGQTQYSIKTRLSGHLKTENLIGIALRKYGLENFKLEIIDRGENKDECNIKEIFWISFFKTLVPYGYNQTIGGKSTTGFKHSVESKNNMSNLRKGNYTKNENHYYGKHHSEEVIQKMKSKWNDRRGRENIVINLETLEVFEDLNIAAKSINACVDSLRRYLNYKKHGYVKGTRWMYYNDYLNSKIHENTEPSTF